LTKNECTCALTFIYLFLGIDIFSFTVIQVTVCRVCFLVRLILDFFISNQNLGTIHSEIILIKLEIFLTFEERVILSAYLEYVMFLSYFFATLIIASSKGMKI
jgi:hypothetical protein